MHRLTSFLDFQILKLIYFQKISNRGQGRAKGGPMLPPPPLKETLAALTVDGIIAVQCTKITVDANIFYDFVRQERHVFVRHV